MTQYADVGPAATTLQSMRANLLLCKVASGRADAPTALSLSCSRRRREISRAPAAFSGRARGAILARLFSVGREGISRAAATAASLEASRATSALSPSYASV
jgi:hypothetical protein